MYRRSLLSLLVSTFAQFGHAAHRADTIARVMGGSLGGVGRARPRSYRMPSGGTRPTSRSRYAKPGPHGTRKHCSHKKTARAARRARRMRG